MMKIRFEGFLHPSPKKTITTKQKKGNISLNPTNRLFSLSLLSLILTVVEIMTQISCDEKRAKITFLRWFKIQVKINNDWKMLHIKIGMYM